MDRCNYCPRYELNKRVGAECKTCDFFSIVAPEGAINGDMIKAMFPDCCSNMGNLDNGIVVDFMGDLHTFNKDWWNAPYKGEKGENNMTNIELVVKIPEEAYKLLNNEGVDWLGAEHILNAVANGTPLPKEHGRLSDIDELVKSIVKEYGVNSIHELPQDIKMFYDKFINSTPTILDATFDYKLKNYAVFRKEVE